MPMNLRLPLGFYADRYRGYTLIFLFAKMELEFFLANMFTVLRKNVLWARLHLKAIRPSLLEKCFWYGECIYVWTMVSI